MLNKRSIVLTLVLMGLYAPLLYSQSYVEFSGVWNGGGSEIYMEGNERYCLRAIDGSSATISLSSSRNSCIFLSQGSLITQQCGSNPSITVSNLSGLYNVVVGPDISRNNLSYILGIFYDGTFDRCSDYYMAGYLGMSQEALNFSLAIAGVLTSSMFLAALVYFIVTLGNF